MFLRVLGIPLLDGCQMGCQMTHPTEGQMALSLWESPRSRDQMAEDYTIRVRVRVKNQMAEDYTTRTPPLSLILTLTLPLTLTLT